MSNNQPWEPLGMLDFFVLGMVSTFQLVALGVCAHLVKWRKWPPYLTKNVDVVIISTFAGILWTATKAIEVGFVRRRVGDLLAACDFERFLAWGCLSVHVVAFFVRVYRMWRILIKHDENMWHTEHQILFLSGICLIPVVTTWLIPGTAVFDEESNSCATNSASMYPTLGMNALGMYGICYLWFVCIRRLKSVRKQFNEYQTMKRTLLYLTLALLSYALVVVVLLAGQHVTVRRVAILYPVITTYILLWGSIREPFMKKILGDDEYLWSYTKGFSELPSPAQLKASLAEQLSVEQLRDEFRQYIKTKVAQELIDFYLDSLDREEVMGFFERQAATMRIVERYIREDAPDQVNISEECREKILATDVTAYDIFDEARAEVLVVMETNFQREFVQTEGFRRIADASEVEHREICLLRAGGMLPSASPSPASPLSPVSPLHPSRLLSALRSLPLVKRLRSTAPLSVGAAAEHSAAVVRDAAADGDGGGGASTARSSSRAGGGGGDLAGGKPPRRSGDAAAMGSKSTSLLGVLEMGVVEEEKEEEEEEEAFTNDLRDGFTTPIYSDVGGARGDGRGRAAISTPSRGDGYTTDEGHEPGPLGGFDNPVNEDEDGFRTPVSRHSRMLL
ncbi:unnamed protein product [Ectocarpus sp. 4 AP-2014]